jgi:hypothetical protein
VLFDRICRENGITHRLTKPRSPTTTGKVERFHQSLRRELLDDHEPFSSVADAQAAIDTCRHDYNTDRPHQSLGMAFPADRFRANTEDSIPPPIATGPITAGGPIEVDRTINGAGAVALAGRQHPVGFHLAGRRVIIRLDRGVLHLLDTDRTVLRSLPNPLTPAELNRIRDARPGGPAPLPGTGPLRVDRWVSCRGSISIARQKIRVGIGHAGRTVTVEEADTTFRVFDGDQLLTETVRTATQPIARFKARKPQPSRRQTKT